MCLWWASQESKREYITITFSFSHFARRAINVIVTVFTARVRELVKYIHEERKTFISLKSEMKFAYKSIRFAIGFQNMYYKNAVCSIKRFFYWCCFYFEGITYELLFLKRAQSWNFRRCLFACLRNWLKSVQSKYVRCEVISIYFLLFDHGLLFNRGVL